MLSFLRAHPPAVGAEGLNVLGIGVGDGSFDLRLIDTLRALGGEVPLSYVAVEPNEAQLEGFRSRVNGAPERDTPFTFLAVRAEDYVPERRFDLIHYIHSLYLQADMQRAPESLRQRVLEALAELSQVVEGRRLLPHPSGVFMAPASLGG